MWMYDTDNSVEDCPLNLSTGTVGGNVDPSATVWQIWARHSNVGGLRYNFGNIYLSFGTAALPDTATVTAAEVRLSHHSTATASDVLLYGGTQPVFGYPIVGADFDDGTTLLGSQAMNTIQSQGFANFTVVSAQINKSGRTQFKVTLGTSCPWPSGNTGTDFWEMDSPHASAGRRPELTVTYQP
jgi:asparagine N-glycosylation enzyme membrane subunit Stt3